MNKENELRELKIKADKDSSLPLRQGATQIVFGDGNPESKLFFLGEAPGFHEDQKGIPFVGRAGQLLNQTLGEVGIERKDIWISNVLYFRPPSNRDPEPNEIETFQPYVDKQISIIDPDIIITLGRFSMGKFLPGVKISQVHGKPKWISFADRRRVLIPMYHPAAALRSTSLLQQFKIDFQNIPKVINKLKKLDHRDQMNDKSDQQSLF